MERGEQRTENRKNREQKEQRTERTERTENIEQGEQRTERTENRERRTESGELRAESREAHRCVKVTQHTPNPSQHIQEVPPMFSVMINVNILLFRTCSSKERHRE